MKIALLMEVYDISDICPIGNKDLPVYLRIEIFKTLNSTDIYFFPRVWMKEDFRVQPTLPQDSKGGCIAEHMCDNMFLYEEETLGWDEIKEISSEKVLEKVLVRIKQLFENLES